MASGIYKIQSISHPERIYIGSAVNFSSRWRHHRSKLSLNKHHSPKLQHHYNKYGKDDLIFSIVCVCDKKDLIPVDNVVWVEQCFLWAYEPWFNICKIAGSMLGYKFSQDVIERLREKKTGVPSPKKGKHYGTVPWNKGKKGVQVAWNKGLVGYCKGKTLSQESKDAVSKAQKGKPKSQKTKDKLSIALKAYFKTDDGIAKANADSERMSGSKRGKYKPRKIKQAS